MKKIIISSLLILILTSCSNNTQLENTNDTSIIKQDNTPVENKNENIANNQKIISWDVRSMNDFNSLSTEQKLKYDCAKLESGWFTESCESIKNNLKVDNLIYSSDINKSLNECDSFVKSNAWVFNSATKCRMKIVLKNILLQANPSFPKTWKLASCELLKEYKEDAQCEQTLSDIKKYIDNQRIEKVANEYQDVLQELTLINR